MPLPTSESAACETCGKDTSNISIKLCRLCWEVESRLNAYLESPRARQRIEKKLTDTQKIDKCCSAALAKTDGEIEETRHMITCDCGKTWVSELKWEFQGQERMCTACGHWSCPCCIDFCDVVGEKGEICTCNGECSYATPSPIDAEEGE